MIHVHSHGTDLRLSHRFDSGWWVREARTSQTIGTIRHGGVHWWCDALVVWYREHHPDALGVTTAEVKA